MSNIELTEDQAFVIRNGIEDALSIINLMDMPDTGASLRSALSALDAATPATYQPNHEKWLDIDWDDRGGIRSYNVEHCTCTTPWRHRP